ncbi:restriction endonuclease [Marinomonas sp. PE14-40]|uniref:restriction endonuclease n=1 Tax=Marinomonas sp. PE14-40 TaxID=3060621 RepID=UPI003F676EF2
MSIDLMQQKRPILFQGKSLPLTELSADSFEDFIHMVLIELGKNQGYEIVSGPLNSGDHGFDLVGKRTIDNKIMCIQCKRYNSVPVGLPVLSEELAKVAINSYFENSNIKEHYILTTGSLTKELNSQLRSENKTKIIESSLKTLNNKSLKSIVKKCKKLNFNADYIVRSYIEGLDKIVVWSGRDIDNNLGTIWSNIDDSLEKHFKIERVLKEYPRPDFNLFNYIENISSESTYLHELIATSTALPPNISNKETYDYSKDPLPPFNSNEKKSFLVNELLTLVSFKKTMILIGSGGAGKTTTLKNFQSIILNEFKNHENNIIPIYIKLSAYRNNLDGLINETLGLNFGDWKSLPYKFFLLLDGLDEIKTDYIDTFTDQFNRFNYLNNVKYIISLRKSGLQLPAIIKNISSCYSLNNLNIRQIINFSEENLKKEDSRNFLEIFLEKINSLGAETFTLPFGLMVAINFYKNNGDLPDNLYDMVIDIVDRKIHRNKKRKSSINHVPISTVKALFESFAFEVRVVEGKAALYREEAEYVVVSALNRLKENKVFGASDLTENQAFLISEHFEMQRAESNGLYVMDHDLVADCLSAKLLAKHWKAHINKAGSKAGWDAWAFASSFIQDEQKDAFIQSLILQDIVLTARCYNEMNDVEESQIEKALELESKGASLRTFSRVMEAASILKSKMSIELLKSYLGDVNHHKSYIAQRFLAKSGDIKFLKSILKDNEKMKAGGLNPSGGTYDMWFEAPAKIITNISREEVDRYLLGEVPYIPIALETIEFYGNKNDYDRIKAVFDKTTNSAEFYIASRCLLLFYRNKAIDALIKKIENGIDDETWLYAMNVLTAHNYSFNITPVLEVFLSTTNKNDNYVAFDHITKALCVNSLPLSAEKSLLNMLKKLDLKDQSQLSYPQFYNIWRIATAHKFISFSDLAFEYFNSCNIEKLIVGITYGSENFIEGKERKVFIEKCILKLNESIELEKLNFNIISLLFKVLIDFDKKEVVVNLAENFFKKQTPLYFDCVFYEGDDLDKKLKFDYEHAFPSIINSLVKVIDKFENEILIELVGIRLSFCTENLIESYFEIIKLLPREPLEDKIAKIPDLLVKINYYNFLLKLEKKETTRLLIKNNFKPLISHHICYPTIIEFIRHYFDDEIKKTIIDSILIFEWNLENILIQCFESVIQELAFKCNKDDIDSFLNPALSSSTNTASTYLIELWINLIDL